MTSEFDIIARYFAPLAAESALGLTDDAAYLTPPEGCDLVLTKDALVEGVHFRSEDAPDLVAQKLARVNLSDLAAKGARPLGYLLATAFPDMMTEDWVAGFAAGLKADQEAFGWALLGGDTVSTSGPFTLTLTAIGAVRRGQMVRRGGGVVGDLLFVTGSIGDGFLGLEVLEKGLPSDGSDWLVDRYLRPQPRLALGEKLPGIASGAVDISDGLIADLEHLADASGVRAKIDLTRIPLSEPAQALVLEDRVSLEELATGGDDYELCIAVSPDRREALIEIAAATQTRITEIGYLTGGEGVEVLGEGGKRIDLKTKGYDHFSE